MTFRQKILIAYLAILLIFLAFLFPFVGQSVRRLLLGVLEVRSHTLINEVVQAPDLPTMIRELRERQRYSFYRITLIDPNGEVLYDSHPGYLAEDVQDVNEERDTASHLEVIEAFEHGVGYNAEYSKVFGQKFAYVALAFNYHDKTYVMRTAFPIDQMDDLTNHLEVGFLSLGVAILVLFSIMTWVVINHITRPIEKIIAAVRPYQEDERETIPIIDLGRWAGQKDEFGKLAETLNSLSTRIHHQIDTLTRERNEKSTILEALMEGVIAITADQRISYANRTAVDILGSTLDDLLLYGLNRPEERILMNLSISCQSKKEILTLNDVQWADRRYYLDIVAIPKDTQDGAILVLQDKTTHYRALERGKDFVANASHELKTPITIIQGFAETLHDNPDLSREVAIEITEKILRNCRRMEKLVRNLLVLADMDTNLPLSRIQECSIMDLMTNCVQLLQAVYRTANVTIRNSNKEDIFIAVDPTLFELAIMNLLDNAAKYSTPPAIIDIKVEQTESHVTIEICDQGIGIPEEDVHHIFDRFYTVDKAHSRRMGGSGLGLSICRTIIEKHFGKIALTSRLGEGTTFTITLPIYAVPDS